MLQKILITLIAFFISGIVFYAGWFAAEMFSPALAKYKFAESCKEVVSDTTKNAKEIISDKTQKTREFFGDIRFENPFKKKEKTE